MAPIIMWCSRYPKDIIKLKQDLNHKPEERKGKDQPEWSQAVACSGFCWETEAALK